MSIYDAATFVLQQTLSTPGIVRKIQGSPDGFILFFAHSVSITMWDVQTGGLIHTFTVQSEISDIAVSPGGTHIACGSSDGSVTFWETYTKQEGEGFGNGQPVVTINWLSSQELAVATQGSVYVHDIDVGGISSSFSIPNHVWGMVYSVDKDVDIGLNEDGGDDEGKSVPKGRFMVGTSLPDHQQGSPLESVRTNLANRPTEPMLVSFKARYTKLWGNRRFLQSIRNVGHHLFTPFLDLFLRKGGKKGKVSTYRSYVPDLYK